MSSDNVNPELLHGVAEYFTAKITENGYSPKGVDWKDDSAQIDRFNQLAKVLPETGQFTVLDLGCGYGALLDYLSDRYAKFEYVGIDISPEMIRVATEAHSDKPHARFAMAVEPGKKFDFAIASGIFNIKMDAQDSEWTNHVQQTLIFMNESSKRGFSSNFLTSYSDLDKRRDNLYYANPLEIFDFCKTNFSANVSLLHDYGIWDFTIVVRKG